MVIEWREVDERKLNDHDGAKKAPTARRVERRATGIRRKSA
jgi:hypothetical protein